MIHTNLPIYKKGYDLLTLAADVQLNMPRTFKQSLGKRVHDECVDLLLEIGYANASRGEKRCDHIRNVLRGLEVVSLMMRVSFDKGFVSRKVWAQSMEMTNTIGEYPTVSLADARRERERVRELVKKGINPTNEKRTDKLRQTTERENTFKAIAKEWVEKKKSGWSPYYLKQVLHGMDSDIYPEIGNLPMRQITAAHVLKILNKVCDRGAETVAINVRQWCSSVFRYAVATLRADYDPVAALRDAIIRPPVENAQPMHREQLKPFILKLREYGGLRTTQLAIRFMLYTFVRTVEMRRGAWSEVKFNEDLWVIPGDKMKKKRVHMIPLSCQAAAVLRELHKITGAGDNMFPNSRRPDDVMSATTINRAMEYLGVPFSGHDFRATASTHLYEMGYEEKLVEMQLAHAEKKKSKAAYNHAQYLPERRAMMQVWADWIDAIEAEALAELSAQ